MVNRLTKHAELLAAIGSGVLIGSAFLLEKMEGLSESALISIYIAAYLIGGWAKAKEGIEDSIESRSLNVELLMILAAICAASIGYWHEGAILIFIFAMSGALETYTLQKNETALLGLMSLQPDVACRIHNDEEEHVHVQDLQLNDIILIKPGERI
ncbi:MAG: heavy metal translocating P-type ATPase, partial [Bacilli bacterium]